MMKGLELSRAYFEEYGKPMIDTQLAQYRPYMAAGLVGEGSECLGFDDEFPRITISDRHSVCGCRRNSTRRQVPRCRGHTIAAGFLQGYTRITSAQGGGRIGVLPLEGFYRKFTGLSHAPQDNMEWFRIPERFLATVTSGEVFEIIRELFHRSGAR